MSDDTIAVRCKSCGEKLNIPKHLKEFSCMFCGARMTFDELFRESKSVAVADAEACREYALRNMIRCVSEHRDIHRDFGKQTYAEKSDDYKNACREIIEKLDFAVSASADKARLLESAASRFMDDMEKLWKGDSRSKSHSKRTMMLEDDKIIIALYMIPMIYDLELPSSSDIADAIHAEWMRRYPRSPFSLARRSDIEQGFQHKWCFITTAVCRAEGKPDNCRELTALRSFRDGYMASTAEGRALIAEYYEIAPMIVACIDYADDSTARYDELRERYIVPCLCDIEAGRMEACRQRYSDMVNMLRRRYLPS